MIGLHSSVTTITFDVDWEASRNTELLLNEVRTIGGKEANQLWSVVDGFVLPVQNIPSSDGRVINDWWMNTTQLSLFVETDIYSVYITSQQQPFQGLPKPYQTEWEGTIELGVI